MPPSRRCSALGTKSGVNVKYCASRRPRRAGRGRQRRGQDPAFGSLVDLLDERKQVADVQAKDRVLGVDLVEDEDAARPQHAHDLADRALLRRARRQVVKGVDAVSEVERTVGERQRLRVALAEPQRQRRRRASVPPASRRALAPPSAAGPPSSRARACDSRRRRARTDTSPGRIRGPGPRAPTAIPAACELLAHQAGLLREQPIADVLGDLLLVLVRDLVEVIDAPWWRMMRPSRGRENRNAATPSATAKNDVPTR